ncbi:hypothetical protein MKX03_009856 [Papaver bracteatum]|nr:hypothetical protein MKX03_009856 [Papaver bracteatum]
MLKKDANFIWMEEQQKAFEKNKKWLIHPHVLQPPIKGEPLYLYLAHTETSIGVLVAQDMGGANLIHIYYLSKTLKDAELRYTLVEKACLPLILAAQKIRHYLLNHKCYVVAAANPIVYLTTKPIQSGKFARWSMQLL